MDHEGQSRYDLSVQASDGGHLGENILTSNTTVHIEVTDTNEFFPKFDPPTGVYEITIKEESTVEELIQVSNVSVHRATVVWPWSGGL